MPSAKYTRKQYHHIKLFFELCKKKNAKLICVIFQKITLFLKGTSIVLQNVALLRKTVCNITKASLCIILKRHFAIFPKVNLHYFAKLCIITQNILHYYAKFTLHFFRKSNFALLLKVTLHYFAKLCIITQI